MQGRAVRWDKMVWVLNDEELKVAMKQWQKMAPVIAMIVSDLHKELMKQGFSKEESMAIITSLNVSGR